MFSCTALTREFCFKNTSPTPMVMSLAFFSLTIYIHRIGVAPHLRIVVAPPHVSRFHECMNALVYHAVSVPPLPLIKMPSMQDVTTGTKPSAGHQVLPVVPDASWSAACD